MRSVSLHLQPKEADQCVISANNKSQDWEKWEGLDMHIFFRSSTRSGESLLGNFEPHFVSFLVFFMYKNVSSFNPSDVMLRNS